MGNVQKTSRWLGVKLGVAIIHRNGMIESYEESSGTSVEAWVDKGETVEGVSNQLLGKLQDLVDAERTRIKSEMRVLASFHAGPTIPRIHEEMLDRPPAEMPDQEKGEPPKGEAELLEVGGELDDRFWFSDQDRKLVSECSIAELQWHVDKGRIYMKGTKEGAEKDDKTAYKLARAIDYQLAKKKKEK